MNAFIATAITSAFVLAGEHVVFDASLRPLFSDRQIRATAPEVRAGLARWAVTLNGRRLIARFNSREYAIVIAEDAAEEGPGRAPQPALATLVASSDHRALKTYTVILNPEFRLAQGRNIFPSRQPASQTDMMAAALAGEMLHVDFYSRGISLPHHQRSDFQQEWRAIARELGCPDMKHEDDDERALRYVGTR
jgi:hypothetical protein